MRRCVRGVMSGHVRVLVLEREGVICGYVRACEGLGV